MRGAGSGAQVVVVDASAVVALVASRSEPVERLATRLNDTMMHAPDVLPVEIDSALRGLVLGGKLTPAQGEAARVLAHDFPIELWPWELLTDRAWELRDDLTTYDAGYVALAERLGAPLMTGDARMAGAGGRCTVEVFAAA